jgi:hypothetical protein
LETGTNDVRLMPVQAANPRRVCCEPSSPTIFQLALLFRARHWKWGQVLIRQDDRCLPLANERLANGELNAMPTREKSGKRPRNPVMFMKKQHLSEQMRNFYERHKNQTIENKEVKNN